MVSIEYPDYLQHIRLESRRFRDVLAGCDPTARVPACPDWDAADLLWHLAEVQWFWALVIRTRPNAPQDDLRHPTRPGTYTELLETFDDFSGALVTELERAEPTEHAWHWGPVQTVGASYRRQAHEALIHRLDAEQAAEVTTGLDPVLAADGVLELIDVMYGGEPPAWGRFEPGPHHVALDLDDVGERIWARPGLFFGTDPESQKNHDSAHVLAVLDPGVEPDAVIRGTAEALDAWLWHRSDSDAVEITGDLEALEAFRAAVSPALD